MSDHLKDLANLTDARFQAEQGKLLHVLREEQDLRKKIAALDAQHRGAQSRYLTDISGQKSFGGDVLWQGWVGRSRRQLQLELAQVLLRKSQMMRALQYAHGRKLAAQSLEAEAHTHALKMEEKQRLEQEQSLFLMEMTRVK